MKAQRVGLIAAAALSWGLIYASMLSSIPVEAKQQPAPAPSGAIGDPITGTPEPTGWLAPAISGHSKPPKEPRLTMPPTDTE